MNTRWIILKILDAIEFEGIFVHDALDRETQGLDLSRQERGFIKKVVFGTIENRIYIDWVIDRFSKVKVRKMKPAIRHTMRLSVYQLLFMPNVPQSAVCNEAVKLVKKRKMHRLTGFVNGVLRSVIREMDTINLPDKDREGLKYLSVKYSYEEEVIKLLLEDMSFEEAESFLEVSNSEAPLTGRLNPAKGSQSALEEALKKENVTISQGLWLTEAFHIQGVDRLADSQAFMRGLFQIQDESSMLVGYIGVASNPAVVLDMCSAPGGKATHIAGLLPESKVHAYDVSVKKTDLIKENVSRLGLENVIVGEGDATQRNESLVNKADLVIADVPCSGLGILRKKPDIKWHTSEEKIQSLISLQRDIISNVKDYVKPGGVLIYSTCTVLSKENEDNVRWFLENNGDFELLPIEGPYAAEGMVKLKPMAEGPDGFFIARMRKKG